MYAFIELLTKLIDVVMAVIKKNKEEKLNDEYAEINDDVEGYLSATRGDVGSGLYKPDGKKPTSNDV